VEVDAGRAVEIVLRETRGLAGRTAEARAVTEESDQAVFRAEPAATGRRRQRRRDVERQFAERSLIPVGTLLGRQPDGFRPSTDRQRRRQSVDAVVLENVVALLLPEQPGDEAPAIVLRRGQPQLVAGLRVSVLG